MSQVIERRAVYLAVLVAALGYFVDIYDLILFSVVRIQSLKAIGVSEADALDVGLSLIKWQNLGMLTGGILWGILGDRRGRLSVLFGSILLYSIANLANAAVTSVETYRILRFIAGIGLAGELGAGVTLVSELMRRESRGIGTTIVATIGILGAIAAELVASNFTWRIAYVVGGVLGLMLLVLRISVRESPMFVSVRSANVNRGNFFSLFANRNRAKRYLAVIVVAVPIWYVVGILVSFSPEFAKAMGLPFVPSTGRAIMWCYAGLAAGDLLSGLLSQSLRSRRKAIAVFLGATVLGCVFYFLELATTVDHFYLLCAIMGVGIGYWAVFMMTAAEQFGTNLRATAATSAPNFVRGSLVPIIMGFTALRDGAGLGVVKAGMVIGIIVLGLACVALFGLDETYGKDLNYVEAETDPVAVKVVATERGVDTPTN